MLGFIYLKNSTILLLPPYFRPFSFIIKIPHHDDKIILFASYCIRLFNRIAPSCIPNFSTEV